MKRELKKEREGRGRERKDSFFFLPHPFPALLLAPFFARSLTLVPRSLLLKGMLLSGEPRGPGGDVLPIMASFFSNNGQIMHMNIISLILVWHFCWVSNTRWLEKILKRKDWEPYLTTNIRSFTKEFLPTMKKTNKQQLQQNNGRLQDIRILMYKGKNWLCPQLVRDFSTSQQPPPYNLRRSDFVLPRFVTVTALFVIFNHFTSISTSYFIAIVLNYMQLSCKQFSTYILFLTSSILFCVLFWLHSWVERFFSPSRLYFFHTQINLCCHSYGYFSWTSYCWRCFI